MEENRITVMLIDDSYAMNIYHEKLLKQIAIVDSIEKFNQPEVAYETIVDRFSTGLKLPSLIILDINMPKLNGWELLDQLRLNNPSILEESKIIMLTTSLNGDDLEKSKTYPIRQFLNKPIGLSKLNEVIHSQFPVMK